MAIFFYSGGRLRVQFELRCKLGSSGSGGPEREKNAATIFHDSVKSATFKLEFCKKIKLKINVYTNLNILPIQIPQRETFGTKIKI